MTETDGMAITTASHGGAVVDSHLHRRRFVIANLWRF